MKKYSLASIIEKFVIGAIYSCILGPLYFFTWYNIEYFMSLGFYLGMSISIFYIIAIFIIVGYMLTNEDF
jgi:hypothetical protein